MYRSRLVPRILPVLGLVGAPLLLAADIAIFFLLRRHRPRRHDRRVHLHPDRRVGVLARRLPDRQGLPALGRRGAPARERLRPRCRPMSVVVLPIAADEPDRASSSTESSREAWS